jgi:hypothetical protein
VLDVVCLPPGQARLRRRMDLVSEIVERLLG